MEGRSGNARGKTRGGCGDEEVRLYVLGRLDKGTIVLVPFIQHKSGL